MSKKKKALIFGLCALVLAVGSFFGGYFSRTVFDSDLSSLNFILKNYKKYYLDEDEDYIGLMGNGLFYTDPYSSYYSAKDYDEIVMGAEGYRAGLGITVESEGLEIFSVKLNSPADKAGIKAGGKIVGGKKVGGEEFTELNNFGDFSSFLSETEEGERFTLKIVYGETYEEYTLAGEDYRETFVLYADGAGAYKFTDGNGTLTFSRFSDGYAALPENAAYLYYSSFTGIGDGDYASARQVKIALDKFKADGKKSIIIDLRDNGGGYMDVMGEVAAHFLAVPDKSKKVIAVAKYKDGKKENFKSAATDFGEYGFEKIVILANDGTASASEAFIGAVLDYDEKGIVKVVLEKSETTQEYRTFGKGIMQTTFVRASGEALKLTTAKTYWPISDVCIHGVGITQNIERYSGRIYAPEVTDGDYALLFAYTLL